MLLWRHSFEKHLKAKLGEDLTVVWTDNRRVMISLRRVRGGPVLRLHESFATAGPQVRDDLVQYLVYGRRVPQSIRDFVRGIATAEKGPVHAVTRGKNRDLRKIYKKLNREYFGERLKAKITWGRGFFGRRRNSITFGSYVPERGLIRIHPVLDTELVPLYYLESVVFHEMAHEFLDTLEEGGSRRLAHSAKFREVERRFKYYGMAEAWEKSHLLKLLRYKPRREK